VTTGGLGERDRTGRDAGAAGQRVGRRAAPDCDLLRRGARDVKLTDVGASVTTEGPADRCGKARIRRIRDA
jgi:hypothetical protein